MSTATIIAERQVTAGGTALGFTREVLERVITPESACERCDSCLRPVIQAVFHRVNGEGEPEREDGPGPVLSYLSWRHADRSPGHGSPGSVRPASRNCGHADTGESAVGLARHFVGGDAGRTICGRRVYAASPPLVIADAAEVTCNACRGAVLGPPTGPGQEGSRI